LNIHCEEFGSGMNFPELASGLVVGGAWYKLDMPLPKIQIKALYALRMFVQQKAQIGSGLMPSANRQQHKKNDLAIIESMSYYKL
jgi:hypothetical protein